MINAIVYLAIGLGFYTGVALCRPHTFRGAPVLAIIRGVLFGILLWPLSVVYIASRMDTGREED